MGENLPLSLVSNAPLFLLFFAPRASCFLVKRKAKVQFSLFFSVLGKAETKQKYSFHNLRFLPFFHAFFHNNLYNKQLHQFKTLSFENIRALSFYIPPSHLRELNVRTESLVRIKNLGNNKIEFEE